MTVKEKTRPGQRTTRPLLAPWLMVGAIVAGLALLAIRVVDLAADDPTAVVQPAPVAGTSGSEWTLEQELAAIRARTGVVLTGAKPWTLADEIAAIRAHNGVNQPGSNSEPATQSSGPR